MHNLILENKCNILDCEKEHDFIIDDIKYCLEHCPVKDYKTKIKKIAEICLSLRKKDFHDEIIYYMNILS